LEPVVVLVRHKTYGWPVKDAPVDFHSDDDAYRYAEQPSGEGQATLQVLTDAEGLASAYMKFPSP
jgi:hypothetical protein